MTWEQRELATPEEKWGVFSLALYCCDKDHDEKQLGEEKVYTPSSLEARAGAKGPNLESRTEAELEEVSLLAFSPLACPVTFLIVPSLGPPAQAWHHPQCLGPPTSISN